MLGNVTCLHTQVFKVFSLQNTDDDGHGPNGFRRRYTCTPQACASAYANDLLAKAAQN